MEYKFENEVDDGLFDDVKDPKHPYFTAIYWAVDKGITKGYTGTNLFGIDDPRTRGQAMMFLWRKPASRIRHTRQRARSRMQSHRHTRQLFSGQWRRRSRTASPMEPSETKPSVQEV